MMTQTTLQIAGMHCGNCAHRLGTVLQRLEGVIKADVDLTGPATIRYDEQVVTEDQLAQAVRMAGFDLA